MSSRSWFSGHLRSWYAAARRDLPWRRTSDPYRIWLSEVILQQTRVDQGLAYYERFVARWPTVRALATADVDEVLREWQGLGYYSRARNLHAAARAVVAQHDGRFPAGHRDLMTLPGVGDYTAAAIASIAFGHPEPVVDGNVYRVLARVFDQDTPIDSTSGRKLFRELAADLLDHQAPGDHNQALMELGALVCKPIRPLCAECPVRSRCLARSRDRIDQLPVKAGRTRIRERHFNYLHIAIDDGLYLRKRADKDIWQGLYELPLLETGRRMGRKAFGELLHGQYGPGWTITASHGPVRHVLSHQVIHAMFWTVVPPAGPLHQADWKAVPRHSLERHALPRLIERYLATWARNDAP